MLARRLGPKFRININAIEALRKVITIVMNDIVEGKVLRADIQFAPRVR
jgi:histone H3/H4